MTETTHNGSAPRASVRRVALASMIGTSIEWYDLRESIPHRYASCPVRRAIE